MNCNTPFQTGHTFSENIDRVARPGRESELHGRFFDQALAELARRQHVVFGLDQLRELGLTARAVQKRAAVGRLHRIHAGVYSLVPKELLKREGLYMAAVLACGPGAVLSHRSAAVLHELRDWGATKIEVTVPRRSARQHDGIKVHRTTTLTDADVAVENNIPCTSVARTLLDLADVVTHRQLERSFDQAELNEVLDLKEIEDQLARNPTRGAAKAVRKVLDEHYIGKTATANENEELLLSITRGLGLPDPETNQYIALPDGGPPIKADFLWRQQRVIVEADSSKWHGTRQRIENDRRRDQRLTVAGWTVIRTSWRQMTYQPDELRKVLLKLLPQTPRRPGAPAIPVAAGAPAPAQSHTRRAGGSTS
ncbi:MAG: type IV toxin-antitoxin system AbiEi family antitoxin domain-containing protein [Solirubrobacterales bacterium]|nr:type IV toxin-antitoxin system AbiEi family antitoxin domain-containing protein [Solirubrobacterales bacterium]